MADDENGDGEEAKFQKILGEVVFHVANEALILARYEGLRAKKLPWLWEQDDTVEFNERLNEVVAHLGGPPTYFISRTGSGVEPPPSDTYPAAALRETISAFTRARKSVLRAHIFMAGSNIMSFGSGELMEPRNPAADAALAKHATAAFWEHAETAYIRLASFWDRVGQIMEFAFFNIRKFDQHGFTGVMDRLHTNIRPMQPQLANTAAWKNLHKFKGSHEPDGLQWLLQRRNLIVHSLHLHPIEETEEGVFRSQHNHLDVAHREKLRPRAPEHETAILLAHLERASALFGDVLVLLERSAPRRVEQFLD